MNYLIKFLVGALFVALCVLPFELVPIVIHSYRSIAYRKGLMMKDDFNIGNVESYLQAHQMIFIYMNLPASVFILIILSIILKSLWVLGFYISLIVIILFIFISVSKVFIVKEYKKWWTLFVSWMLTIIMFWTVALKVFNRMSEVIGY